MTAWVMAEKERDERARGVGKIMVESQMADGARGDGVGDGGERKGLETKW